MKSRFKILTIGIAGFCLLTAAPQSYAEALPQAVPVLISAPAVQQAATVTTKPIKEKNDLITVDLSIPVIEGLKDAHYQEELNDLIYRQAMKDMDTLKTQAAEEVVHAKEAGYEMRPYELNIQYKLKADGGSGSGGMFSLQILTYTYTGGAHGGTRSDNYNVWNEQAAKTIELKNLFGEGYKAFIDEKIKQAIASNPDPYFPDTFKGISDTQNFYIERGDAVIQFAQYEIAPYASGMPEFRIPIATNGTPGEQPTQPEAVPTQLVLNGKPASPEEAASVYKADSGLLMIPLRASAEALGYTIQWDAERQAAELTRDNQWTILQQGKDEYVYNKMAPLSLGEAPVIQSDGKMYVPLAFFSDVLKAEVTSEGGIVSIQLQ
ncbi:stalk domain-containing protein [Paenibacillus solanacearum]|nr:DUF4163 domain-containing protein [Paenibacillus solanacearum]